MNEPYLSSTDSEIDAESTAQVFTATVPVLVSSPSPDTRSTLTSRFKNFPSKGLQETGFMVT